MWLRRAAIAVHGFGALWLLVNGVGHSAAVIVGARAGSLRPGASVPTLIAVGIGLLASGVAFAWTLRPLLAARPSARPALWAAGLLGLVLVLTALRYGVTFLRGSIVLLVIDGAVLAMLARSLARPPQGG